MTLWLCYTFCCQGYNRVVFHWFSLGLKSVYFPQNRVLWYYYNKAYLYHFACVDNVEYEQKIVIIYSYIHIRLKWAYHYNVSYRSKSKQYTPQICVNNCLQYDIFMWYLLYTLKNCYKY